MKMRITYIQKKKMKHYLGNIRTLNMKKTKTKELKKKRKYKNEKSDYYFIINIINKV